MKQQSISYTNRKNSYIVVKRIDEPYGPGTESVVSVGCTLKGDIDNPSWKVHIPVDIVDDVIESMISASKHNDFETLNEDGCL